MPLRRPRPVPFVQRGLDGDARIWRRNAIPRLLYVTTPCDIMMHVAVTELNYSVKVYFGDGSTLPPVTQAGERLVWAIGSASSRKP